MLNDEMKNEFSDFGIKMRKIAICTILLIIPIVNIVAVILLFVYTIKSLGNINRISNTLNNKNLKSYRSYYIISLVIFLVGTIIMILLVANVFIVTNEIINAAGNDSEKLRRAQEEIDEIMLNFRISMILLMIIEGFFISILQIIAWSNINTFFKNNNNIFPNPIAIDAIKGSSFLRIAAIISLITLIPSLIIFYGLVTGIVVFILQIIGYFKLSNLRNLRNPATQLSVSQPTTAPLMPEITKNFCSNCGSSITEDEEFCSSCGSKI